MTVEWTEYVTERLIFGVPLAVLNAELTSGQELFTVDDVEGLGLADGRSEWLADRIDAEQRDCPDVEPELELIVVVPVTEEAVEMNGGEVR